MASSTVAVANAGVRKAAVLLIQLGRDRAASVMAHLSETEVEALSAEIARLDNVTADESGADPRRSSAS